MSWHVNILTLFPEMFPGTLDTSLSGKALEKQIWTYETVNIRDYAEDIHKTVQILLRKHFFHLKRQAKKYSCLQGDSPLPRIL